MWSERAADGGTVIRSASALSTARSISGAIYRSMLAGPHAASCRNEATAPTSSASAQTLTAIDVKYHAERAWRSPGSVIKLERWPAS